MINHTDDENIDERESDTVDDDKVIEMKQPNSEAEEKIAQLEDSVKELNNKYLRAVADADNLRRRLEKEKMDLLRYGNEKILQDLLPVLDSFEKALAPQEEANDTTKSLQEGMRLVFDQLKSALERHGLVRISAKGQPFDPNVHQAIHKIDDDEAETETVSDEFAAGYTLNGRLVRPAMVSVKTPTDKN